MHEIKHRTVPWPRRGRLHPVLAGVALCVFLLAGCATPEQPGDGLQSYSALMRVAASTAQAGDPGAAAALYRHAHQLKPKRPEPLIALGQILDHAHAFTGAENAFEAALKVAPRNTEALRGLGNTLVFLDQPQAAVGKFKAALAVQPNAPDVLNDYGVALDMLGRHKKAQAKYRQGLALAPSDLGLTTNLGLSLALSGDYQQALHDLRPLAGNSESTARMREDLALVYGLTGDNNAAAKVASIDLGPNSVQANLAYYKALRRWVKQFHSHHPSESIPVVGSSRPAAISEAPLGAKAGATSPAHRPPMMAGPVTTLPAAPPPPSPTAATPPRTQTVKAANAAPAKPTHPPERFAANLPKAAKPAPAPAKMAAVEAPHGTAAQAPEPAVKTAAKPAPAAAQKTVAETPKPLVTTVATPASPPLPAKKTTKTALNKAASGTPQPLITAAATPSHLSADKTTETAAEMSPAKKSEAPEAMTKAVAKTAAMAEARPTPGATAIGIDHNEKSPVSAHVQLGSYSTIPIAAANWQALVGHYPMLRRLHPVIVQVDLGSQGIFERLQTGPFPNRTTAAAFCAKLKADNRTCDVLPAKHATVSNIAPSDNTSAETAGLLTTDP